MNNNDDNDPNWVTIGVSAGVGLIVIVIVTVSCVFYHRRCCKSRNTKKTNLDTEVFLEVNKENNIQDTDAANDNTELLNEKEQNGNNDETNPETTVIDMNENIPQKSCETPKENGNLASAEDCDEDVKGERVVSVIYAIPDKSTKQDTNTNIADSKEKANMEENELNEKSDLKVDNSATAIEDAEDVTSPEVDALYSKPNKTNKDVSSIKQDNPQNTRVSSADGYSTIKELMDPKETAPKSGDIPTYEDVKLGDISPPVNPTPPKLPSDSLTRPPRPTNKETNEPLYSEANLDNENATSIESDDVFFPSYAQAQLVPRSQSARERHTSGEEEPKVILGIPGIKKPSVTSSGKSPTELDIPEVDFDYNPDYERVEIPNTSNNTKNETAENSDSGWVDCSIYDRMSDNPSRDSTTVDSYNEAESPKLVTYEQTNIGPSLNSKEQSTEQIAPYAEVNIMSLSDDGEETPQLVTYEQTNMTNPKVNEVVEDDYEEIRRSRLAEFTQVTQTQTIDGKEVPVTEL